ALIVMGDVWGGPGCLDPPPGRLCVRGKQVQGAVAEYVSALWYRLFVPDFAPTAAAVAVHQGRVRLTISPSRTVPAGKAWRALTALGTRCQRQTRVRGQSR